MRLVHFKWVDGDEHFRHEYFYIHATPEKINELLNEFWNEAKTSKNFIPNVYPRPTEFKEWLNSIGVQTEELKSDMEVEFEPS